MFFIFLLSISIYLFIIYKLEIFNMKATNILYLPGIVFIVTFTLLIFSGFSSTQHIGQQAITPLCGFFLAGLLILYITGVINDLMGPQKERVKLTAFFIASFLLPLSNNYFLVISTLNSQRQRAGLLPLS